MHHMVLAGEHQPFAARGAGVIDGGLQGSGRIAPAAAVRQRVDAKNHLPCPVRLMQGGVLVHLVPQVRLIGGHAVHKTHQPVSLPQQPEVVGIHRQPPGEVLPGGGLGGRETGRLHRREGGQVGHGGVAQGQVLVHGCVPLFLFFSSYHPLPFTVNKNRRSGRTCCGGRCWKAYAMPLRALISLISSGTTLNRSPTMP